MEVPKVLPSLLSRQLGDLSVKLESLDIYVLAAALNNVRGSPAYSEALSVLQEFALVNKVRVSLFAGDGYCIVDTKKSTDDNNDPNVFLHDNGFLRSSVSRAMLASENVIENEVKFSNTTKEVDAYVAVRLGVSSRNIVGAVRLAQQALSTN